MLESILKLKSVVVKHPPFLGPLHFGSAILVAHISRLVLHAIHSDRRQLLFIRLV